ncbi:MAG: archaemetzincin family Zn-dependent metalloprotease [Deltaproteobacteria bacterium]|nr:archaemetzincin family Zn-dependent metalloprotease [Deltaproteobacteria bacterium]
MPAIVQVVPVGAAARSFVRDLAEPVSSVFGVEVCLGPPLAEPKYAFNKDRQQYHSAAILRRLAATRGREQLGVLGVAEVDLFIPDTPYVFGEADRESHSAIVSLARLRPEFNGAAQDNDLLRARGRTEVVHEVGHLLGLSHCDDPRCVMYFSSSVTDTDRKGCALCNDCRTELARVVRGR